MSIGALRTEGDLERFFRDRAPDTGALIRQLQGRAVGAESLISGLASVYRPVLFAAGGIGALSAATRIIRVNGSIDVPGTASSVPPVAIDLDDAEYLATGKTTKLNIRARCETNNVAPATTFTIGLHPLTITTGAAGGVAYTVGAAVAGSTVAFASPAANSAPAAVSSGDFNVPADGLYALCVANAGTPTANSITTFHVHLRMRHV